MSSKGNTATLAPKRDASAPQAAILLAVDRLLTAGALYPMGHGRFAAAVAEYRAAAAGAGAARSVTLEAIGEAMVVQGVSLGDGQRGLERLLALYEKLGIEQIRIDADAAVDVLHTLATRLLRQRREADADGHLKQALFDDLPAAVTVTARAFRKRWSDDIDGRFLPVLEAILEDVVAAFDDHAAAEAARRTLERMFSVFLSNSGRDGEATLCSPEDRAFFESMIRSGPHALCRALRGIIEQEGSLGCLDVLFDDSHEALATAGAQSALQILLDAMAGPDLMRDAERPEAEDRRVDDDAQYTIPLAELQATLDGIALDFPPHTVLTGGDMREEVSIYLSILSLGATPSVARQALAGLWHAVSRVRTTADREFLREQALSLMESADSELLDRVLPRLAAPFRDRGVDDVADYWFSLAAGDGERTALIWPHVVLELLRTEPETALHGLSILQSLATAVPPPRMAREAARFELLTAFRPGALNKGLFYRPRPLLYPVYATLLRTSLGGTFGEWLCEGWHRLPDDTAGGLLARVTGPYRAELQPVYEAVLEHGRTAADAAPPRQLLDVVHQALEVLPRDERHLEWVPVAILVLGQWSPASSRRLLERISRERRLVVLRAWPRACRLTAKAALDLADREGSADGN